MDHLYEWKSRGAARGVAAFAQGFDNYEGKPLQGSNDVSIDGKGRLYFTDPAGAAVYRIDAPGKLLKFIPIPEDLITNNAFGGADMKTLYVTAGETLYKIQTEIAGLPR